MELNWQQIRGEISLFAKDRGRWKHCIGLWSH